MKNNGPSFAKRLGQLTPYVPGEQPKGGGLIKLNTNENPYPPSPKVRELLRSYNAEELRLYPDPRSGKLREAIAEAEGLDPANVFVSNGSDESLSFCFFAFFDDERGPLLFPRYTYSFYPVYCDFYRIAYRRIPHKEDFSIDFASLYRQAGRACGVIFPNPNAPTAIYEELSAVEETLKTARGKVVVIDEAYIDFGGETAAALIGKYDNIAVVKTFSKGYSLAGVRLGYVLASEEIISALVSVKDSFNSYPVNRLTESIGIAALSDRAYYRDINSRVTAVRESFSIKLRSAGFEVLPSRANFVMARKPGMPGRELFSFFRENGFLVRYFSLEGIDDFVRITVGTKEQMELLGELCVKNLDRAGTARRKG